jgi:hypothetical protein
VDVCISACKPHTSPTLTSRAASMTFSDLIVRSLVLAVLIIDVESNNVAAPNARRTAT